jgi:hypothetical protein
MPTLEDLKSLMASDAGPAVTITMPAVMAGPEVQQNLIRMGNLLSDAERRLTETGLRGPEAADLLAPARKLLLDQDFNYQQSQGLAVFVAPGVFHTVPVPLALEEAVVVADRFHVKPLLPLFARDGRFLVLSLSVGRVRLFEASKFGLSELATEDVPESIEAVLQRTDFQDAVHYHPTGPAQTTGGPATPKFHALGRSPEDYRKDEVLEFLRRVNAGVTKVLADTDAPLVLAANDQLQGHYRELNKYHALVGEGLNVNPDALDDAELHDRAYAVVAPLFGERRREAEDHFAALAGDDDARALTDLPTIVADARFGRLDVLFAAADVEAWGRFDEADASVELHEARRDGDEDLIGRAVVEGLGTRAFVFVLPRAEMPGHAAVAAIRRY